MISGTRRRIPRVALLGTLIVGWFIGRTSRSTGSHTSESAGATGVESAAPPSMNTEEGPSLKRRWRSVRRRAVEIATVVSALVALPGAVAWWQAQPAVQAGRDIRVAKQLVERGRFDDAQKLIEGAIVKDPSAQVMREAGYFYAKRQEWPTAIQNLCLSLRDEPDNVNALVNASIAYGSVKQPNDALELAHRARDLAPASAFVLRNLAAMESLAGDDDRALQAAQKAFSLEPEDVAWTNMLLSAVRLRKWDVVANSLNKPPSKLSERHQDDLVYFRGLLKVATAQERSEAADAISAGLARGVDYPRDLLFWGSYDEVRNLLALGAETDPARGSDLSAVASVLQAQGAGVATAATEAALSPSGKELLEQVHARRDGRYRMTIRNEEVVPYSGPQVRSCAQFAEIGTPFRPETETPSPSY